MIPEAAEYLEVVGHNDSWNHEGRIDFIASIMKTELDLGGKKVLDLGCRFGLYSYLALRNGASLVVGVDIEGSIIQGAEQAFVRLGIDAERYCFSSNDIANVNFSYYDVVLGLGLFYNIPDHERYLKLCRYHNLPVLAEFCTKNNSDPCPVLWWPTASKIEESGYMAGKEVLYQQYVPNLAYAQMMFARSGFSVKQLSQPGADHSAVFFLLTPSGALENNVYRWGMNKRTVVSLI